MEVNQSCPTEFPASLADIARTWRKLASVGSTSKPYTTATRCCCVIEMVFSSSSTCPPPCKPKAVSAHRPLAESVRSCKTLKGAWRSSPVFCSGHRGFPHPAVQCRSRFKRSARQRALTVRRAVPGLPCPYSSRSDGPRPRRSRTCSGTLGETFANGGDVPTTLSPVSRAAPRPAPSPATPPFPRRAG